MVQLKIGDPLIKPVSGSFHYVIKQDLHKALKSAICIHPFLVDLFSAILWRHLVLAQLFHWGLVHNFVNLVGIKNSDIFLWSPWYLPHSCYTKTKFKSSCSEIEKRNLDDFSLNRCNSFLINDFAECWWQYI